MGTHATMTMEFCATSMCRSARGHDVGRLAPKHQRLDQSIKAGTGLLARHQHQSQKPRVPFSANMAVTVLPFAALGVGWNHQVMTRFHAGGGRSHDASPFSHSLAPLIWKAGRSPDHSKIVGNCTRGMSMDSIPMPMGPYVIVEVPKIMQSRYTWWPMSLSRYLKLRRVASGWSTFFPACLVSLLLLFISARAQLPQTRTQTWSACLAFQVMRLVEREVRVCSTFDSWHCRWLPRRMWIMYLDRATDFRRCRDAAVPAVELRRLCRCVFQRLSSHLSVTDVSFAVETFFNCSKYNIL